MREPERLGHLSVQGRGGEHRFRNGFGLRYFGGYGRIIAGDLNCEAGNRYDVCVANHKDDGYNLIYTGIAVGYAF